MFNALNAVTETKSLLSLAPWANPWLILAVLGAFAQHYLVLSWPGDLSLSLCLCLCLSLSVCLSCPAGGRECVI